MQVSILARPRGRALRRCQRSRRRRCQMFQSSPAPEDGRCVASCSATPAVAECFNPRPPQRTGAAGAPRACATAPGCFNPRPPQRTGAALAVDRASRLEPDVSILARPRGRALRVPADGARPVRSLFQSSPAPEDGRCVRRCRECSGRSDVSILARPRGRALHRDDTWHA